MNDCKEENWEWSICVNDKKNEKRKKNVFLDGNQPQEHMGSQGILLRLF